MFPGLTGTSRNYTLIEVICGIAVFGVLGQIAIWIFIKNIPGVASGWWIGILTAVFYIYSMWWGLNRALDLDPESAKNKMILYNILRYLAVLIIMGAVMITEIANPVAAVLGVFSVKAGAYMQPFIHKFNHHKEDPPAPAVDDWPDDEDEDFLENFLEKGR